MPSLAALVLVGLLSADPQRPPSVGGGAQAASTGSARTTTTRSQPRSRPTFKVVRATVEEYFAKIADYAPGRLIVRGEVEGAFKQLQRVGWPVPRAQQLLQQVPTEGEEWVQTLRTPEGRKFMDQITRFPSAYDRLDRWSRLNGGMREIRATIRGPDGYKLIEYMTTAPGGKNMGEMLSKAPGGDDFNKPTGRVYTVEALLGRLEQLYAEEQKKR